MTRESRLNPPFSFYKNYLYDRLWDVGRAGVLGLLVEGAGPAAQRVAAHRVVNLQSVYRMVLLEIATYSSARCRSRRNQPADRIQNSSTRNSNI